MTHVEFISEVAKRLEWPEENTTGIIETILDIISAELKLNNPVFIDDFGSLKTGVEPEYILVDPETKDRYLMPPAIEVVFEAFFRANEDNPFLQTVFLPDETLYNDLNISFSQFEPTLLNEGVQFPDIPEIIVEEPEEEIETAEYTHTQKENIEIPGQPPSQQKETTEYPQQEDHISVEHSTMLDENGVGEIDKPPEEAPNEKVQEEVAQEELVQEEVFEEEAIHKDTAHGEIDYKEAVQVELTQDEVSSQKVSTGRTVPDSVIKPSPRLQSSRRRQKSRRTSAVWIPIAGGIAIIVASLFFFKGEGDR